MCKRLATFLITALLDLRLAQPKKWNCLIAVVILHLVLKGNRIKHHLPEPREID